MTASSHKATCGPYFIRLSRYGLHRTLEVALPKYTVTLTILKRVNP